MLRLVGIPLKLVSIQLVSPASGEEKNFKLSQVSEVVSIQLVSPASGEPISKLATNTPS